MSKMTKTPHAESMERIAGLIGAFLKARGFRKRRHTFNRSTPDGLVHVVNLQMGTHPVGDHAEIPGFRQNLYGKFTVNLGVFVPELYREMLQRDPAEFVNEYDCSMRARFSDLVQTDGDLWWNLGGGENGTATEIIEMLDQHGLPFLERFANRDDVVQYWPAVCEARKLSPRPHLDVALILQHLGRSAEAVAAFQRHMAQDNHPAHIKYCGGLAVKHRWPTTPPTVQCPAARSTAGQG